MSGTGIRRIALSAGEPAGIGPDLCVMAAQHNLDAELVAIAAPELLRERAALLGLPLSLDTADLSRPPRRQRPGTLAVIPVPLPVPARCGALDRRNSPYVLETLTRAVSGCHAGHFDALVTAPVHKGIINDAGHPFSGHTEFLAAHCDDARVVMMLATGGLRVALVTTHLPLREVCAAITASRLEETLRITARDLQRWFGIRRPRLAVCGLNPHAGEDGHLGHEERDTMIPVLDGLRREGMHLTGPLPADTAFIPKYMDSHDVFVAMYHDQGLPVLKYRGFGDAINVTLGLPFIRTSVDHGTALELAGSGRAGYGSMQAAIDAALTMADHASRTMR